MLRDGMLTRECSMLAVMTMNVGYFMAVLAGTLVGSLLVGRYALSSEH